MLPNGYMLCFSMEIMFASLLVLELLGFLSALYAHPLNNLVFGFFFIIKLPSFWVIIIHSIVYLSIAHKGNRL